MKAVQHKSFFNWSGGKDSALALYYVLRNRQYGVDRLLTNVNSQHNRVSMHGVREELLQMQAAALGIPLQKILLPEQPEMTTYEQEVATALQGLQREGFTHSIFGDIFLADLKAYRELQLAPYHMEAVFPLWQKDTRELLAEFLDLGFKTIVVCTNAAVLDDSFAGRVIDRDFIKDLPAGVDPCGENGEFHTFVFDGPVFTKPVPIRVGEKIFREYKAPAASKDASFSGATAEPSRMGFWFCDLLPAAY